MARDMILLENPLPFFVLGKLFIMTDLNIFLLFSPVDIVKHLVDLAHNNWLPSPAGIEAYRNNGTKNKAGVKFQKVEVSNYSSLVDIKFENGVMKIPILEIGSTTEAFFQNLIAYELCSHDITLKHVLDYVTFLGCLVNSSKDVELLRRLGIISNWLGVDEVIATSTTKLIDGAVLGKPFYYRELWHNYFDSPWSFISFVAAACLLVLTFLQTLYLVPSYEK
ncbi:hypothetical protein CISIN_1g041779mg [Citrus sinensis]|uniref:Uncharacterized protein n=1 Tax=Citrus sinensis TaxID=2711 RepID=A0A067DJK4_CITSI|nr:hypothetical protein CISIN_1g041779mg [Citrus sinensis]